MLPDQFGGLLTADLGMEDEDGYLWFRSRKDDVIIPSGESIIQPGDRIIIFSRRQDIPRIEKILAVKLEYFKCGGILS